MTAAQRDGGPAFPVADTTMTVPTEGMTLRDYFAAKAMAGLLSNSSGPVQANAQNAWDFTNCTQRDVADLAYQVADALLAARMDPQPGEGA